MSQHLALADYVRREFRPAAMVFVVIGNDCTESLLKYMSAPGLHYFAPADTGGLELIRLDYEPRFIRRLLRESALVRYLVFNVNPTTA